MQRCVCLSVRFRGEEIKMNDLAIVTQDDGRRTDEEQFATMRVDGQTFGIPILLV
jgi:hypothetical protein